MDQTLSRSTVVWHLQKKTQAGATMIQVTNSFYLGTDTLTADLLAINKRCYSFNIIAQEVVTISN